MGLLILGLGGFGVTSLGGGITRIGKVGGTVIEVNDYARALRTEMNAATAEKGAPVTLSEANAQGLPQRVLSRLVSQAALEDETTRMGISISDAMLGRQILDIPGFRGLDGKFDRESYRYALERAGLSESQFEEDVRSETASTLLQGAVISGIAAPEAYTTTLLDYIAEERDVTYATLGRNDLDNGLPTPSDADLKAFYEANLSNFTTPESHRITYAWLTPDMIIDEVEVSQDALQAAYAERSEEFQQPERRLLERLVFPDQAAAEAARAQVDSNEASFDDLVAARGLSLQDVDMGDVTADDLGAAGKDVFAANVGDVVGPVDSDLGPALLRVNAILQAQNTSFEEAEPQLRDELAVGRAARVIERSVEATNDLLAGGATIEDLGNETQMQVATIDWNANSSEGIAGYANFRDAAATLQEDDFPEVMDLGDGGIFAMRLDEVVPPMVQPLEDVHDAVAAAWAKDALMKALRIQAEGTVAKLEAGDSFTDVGLTPGTAKGLTRQGFQEGTPEGFIPAVFEMKPGEVRLIEGRERLIVLRLDTVGTSEVSSDELNQLRQTLRTSSTNDIAQDLYVALAEDIRSRAGISLDQQAIAAVHANFQ